MAGIAVVHDYLTQLGGAERVAGQVTRLYPEARLLTSVHDKCEVPLNFVGDKSWQTSFLQPLTRFLPLKLMLPVLPFAVSSLDILDCDLVISSSSGFAHHASRRPGAVHVCYCCTPPRFLWRSDEYFRGQPLFAALLAPLLAWLRRRDLDAAADVDAYIAVSQHIAGRIREVYGREARVVYPPIDVSRFQPSPERSGRFLVVSRLVRSKRVDLVVEAANRYSLPLDIVGQGPELRRLRRQAGPTVRILGWQPDEVVHSAMARSTAVVVAGEEDFGLVAVEAQASGRPPIVFAIGGGAETVADGVTGYVFQEQTAEAIAAAMQRAAAGDLDAAVLIESARRFDVSVFREQFPAVVELARRHKVEAASANQVPVALVGSR